MDPMGIFPYFFFSERLRLPSSGCLNSLEVHAYLEEHFPAERFQRSVVTKALQHQKNNGREAAWEREMCYSLKRTVTAPSNYLLVDHT